MSGRGDLKRMISLRVTEAEYETLKAQYRCYGAASISDLARLAIQQLTQSQGRAAEMAIKLHEVCVRLEVLESRLAAIDEKDGNPPEPRVLQIANHQRPAV